MKKVVLAGVFVLGSSLLEVHAMSGNHQETQDVSRNVSAGMQSVQAEDGGELVVQSVQTSDAEELTVADLKLNEFREEFKTLMYSCISAFYGEQAKEDPKFKLLATVLDDKHKSQMRTLAMLAQSEKNRQKDTFDRQMEAKNAQLEEARNEKIRIEKEKELQSQISRVFIANPSLSREKIMIRSDDINRITDIFRKHNAVQNEYSKLVLFSGLYGREDLEVKAKQSDLTKLSEYVSSTKISPKPAVPALIRDAFLQGHIGLRRHSCYAFPDEDFIRGKYGLEYVILPDGFRMGNQYDVLNWYNHCKDVENAERMNTYNNAMSKWNAEVSRASAVPLPLEEFNRLIEQFNTFLSKL